LSHTHMSSSAKLFIALTVLGIVTRVVLLIWADGTMVDDAYISLRQAENLVEGKGFVYNEGERVLAVSGPLYGLWLAFLLLLSGGRDPGYLIGFTNIAFFALTAWAIWSLRREIGITCSIFVLLIFSIFLRFVDNSLTGMETPLFLLAVLTSLVLLKRQRLGWLSAVLAASILLRPEGIIWAISIMVVLAARREWPRVRNLVPGSLLLSAWLAVSLWYYGSPIPQSVKAKCGWALGTYQEGFLSTFAGTFQALSLLEFPARLISSPPLYARALVFMTALVTVFLFVSGTVTFFRKRSLFMSFPLLFLLYLVSYLAGKGRVDFSWYGIPSGFAYMVTVVSGIGALGRRLPAKLRQGRILGFIGALLAIVLLTSGVLIWRETRGVYYRVLRSSYEKAGDFVDRVASPSDRLLTAEVGMIGYRSKRFVYGMGGIVSPEVMRLYREHSPEMPISDILKQFQPEFVVLDGYHMRRLRTQGDTLWVSANYKQVAEFPAHEVLMKVK
jgi:hypothetical protein